MTREQRFKNRRQERKLRIKIKQQGPSILESFGTPAFNAHDPMYGCAAKYYKPDILVVAKNIKRRIYRYSIRQLNRYFDYEGIGDHDEVRNRIREYLEESQAPRSEYQALEFAGYL